MYIKDAKLPSWGNIWKLIHLLTKCIDSSHVPGPVWVGEMKSVDKAGGWFTRGSSNGVCQSRSWVSGSCCWGRGLEPSIGEESGGRTWKIVWKSAGWRRAWWHGRQKCGCMSGEIRASGHRVKLSFRGKQSLEAEGDIQISALRLDVWSPWRQWVDPGERLCNLVGVGMEEKGSERR